MSKKYLGDVFDIHTGGVDHIPIHHENEIAQSWGTTGKNPAKFWMHGEFMLVNNGKMSKKLGNTYTLDDLAAKGYSPMCFRLFCLNTHYRKKLNFTFEGLDAAKTSYERLTAQILKHKSSPAATDKALLGKYYEEFEREITDDLNIPGALGVLFTMLKEKPSKDIYELAVKMDGVFGLGFADMKEEKKPQEDIPAEIRAIAEERSAARQAKDWTKSDELRGRLAALGWSVKDAKDGYTLTKN